MSRKLMTAALVVATAWATHAETLTFESPVDLASYTVHQSHATNVSVSHDLAGGAGNPATGGLTLLSTNTSNNTVVLLRPDVTNPGDFNQWQVSLLLNFRETNDQASGEKKTESRFGFTATKNLPGDIGKLNEFFHKVNHGISLHAKADHQVGSTEKNRRLEFQLTNYNGNDTNFGKVTLTDTAHLESWIRVTLTVSRAGATTFNATYVAESLGPDGTSALVEIATGTQNGIVNTSLGNAATIYSGFTMNGDKQANTRLYADDHTTLLSNIAPASPTALAPTAINSNGFTANWQIGAGPTASGYLVELTTQADNFGENTFISATGATGQGTGFVVSGGSTVSQVITGLLPLTSYVYRVTALNSAGSSAVSNTIPATTIAGNAAPTFDVIPAQAPVRPTDGAKTITITGITSGGEAGQTVTFTATSSNPTLLPDPTIHYTSPATTATLTYDPNDAGTGDVTITVTANDGQSSNNTLERTFVVPVQYPTPMVGFESDSELVNLTAQTALGTMTRQDGAGIGAPAGSGYVFQGTSTNSDKGAAVWRAQSYSGITSTTLHASIFFNAREADDGASKDKGEVSIGFVGTTAFNASKPQEFLRKTNPALSVKLKAEHDASEAAKVRQLETEVTSFDGFDESKGAKLTLVDSPAFNHWLKVVFDAVKTAEDTYLLSYRIEDWGADGTALVSVLMNGTPIEVTNAVIANDPEIWSAFSVNTEKNGTAKMYFDQWETVVGENPPIAPIAHPAVQVTPNTFLAKWQPGAGVFATGYVLEVSTAADNFTNGFLSASGMPGQIEGIPVAGGTARGFRVTGLTASTAYVYRVRGTNQHGASDVSNVIPFTTLAVGANSLPTLDPIDDLPALNINAGDQSIVLTGVSAGGETNQVATVSATSNNPTLIPDPVVDYTDPNDSGTLYFTPSTSETGTATITVTVEDGQPGGTFSQQFTITVTEPQTLVAFNDANALNRFDLHNYLGSSFAFGTGVGVGNPAGGGGTFSRSGGGESVLVAFRPTTFDARVVPHYTASMFINAREIVDLTSGKDKAEVRLAFIGENTPNASNPKDSMNKTHPSLGLTFKLEHEFNKPDKDRKIEVECFSWNGTSENKGGKETASSVAAASNWLKVTLYIVRGGQDRYYVIYDVADWGVNGTAWQGQVLTGGPFLATNAAFFSDPSVYAGFTLTTEKTSTKNVYLDNHEIIVNTTAADAPLPLSASDVRAREFTAEWTPSVIGLSPGGYVLDITTQANNFAPGTFIGLNGQGGHSTGIHIGSGVTTHLTITGLLPSEHYIYRIRAKRGSEESASIGQTFVTTLATDLVLWGETNFPGTTDPEVIDMLADPDRDGVQNLMEYAFGMNPLASDCDALPVIDSSGAYLRMTYQRRFNAPDVAYVALSCSDLADWQPNTTEIFASPPDANGMQTVIVQDNEPLANHPGRFMRVFMQKLP